ncbi:MAG TPA: hypothetical protein VGK33_18505 [Chloroflexota bacterium]
MVAPKTLFTPMFEDFDEAGRDATNRWYDLDHVPQRLTCPGFLRAERYELAARASARLGSAALPPLRYLNVYYVAGPEVLRSEAYDRQVAAPTVWMARRTGVGTAGTYVRGVWVQQLAATQSRSAHLRPIEGPKTWWLRMQEEDREDIGAVLSCPGVLGAERYESVELDLPGPPSAPPPRLMTIYDVETPEVVTTPEFASHAATDVEWQGIYLQRPSPWTIGVPAD